MPKKMPRKWICRTNYHPGYNVSLGSFGGDRLPVPKYSQDDMNLNGKIFFKIQDLIIKH